MKATFAVVAAFTVLSIISRSRGVSCEGYQSLIWFVCGDYVIDTGTHREKFDLIKIRDTRYTRLLLEVITKTESLRDESSYAISLNVIS